jgi:UDP-N-acetylglucosamine--N-acetylmuramyl-(pentapeptide) pyrophosphoryl-undecaprenol N-acetylglucosamine transferase
MGDRHFFFAGGGTGGHIYPALAVAERIIRTDPTAEIHFFCSTRNIDRHILGQTGFKYTALSVRTFSARPKGFIEFGKSFLASYHVAAEALEASLVSGRASFEMRRATEEGHTRYTSGVTQQGTVVVGVGGFVSAPVCLAAHRRRVPIVLLNVDMVPGRANKIVARWADEIFVQFPETEPYFARKVEQIHVVGCPLRERFGHPQPDEARRQLGLDGRKKILLVTGASSGAENINNAVCSLLGKLDAFAEDWQIVHVAGHTNYDKVYSYYKDAKIEHKVLSYFDNMADLLAAADLVVGRSGAVSVAEYAAVAVPSICMPYPHHKDRQQYLNAGKLVEVGAAVIVDDVPHEEDRAEWLWEELERLMQDEKARQVMAEGCRVVANPGADVKIAEKLLKMADGL